MERYQISHAFTADNLCLSDFSYPVATLQRKYKHLRDLPLPPMDRAQPLLLIGSDMPHLLTPIRPVCTGPPGSPIAVCTKLGWSLQGPTSLNQATVVEQQCLHLATAPSEELFRNVERLWQLDTLPYSAKVVTRSKQDQQAFTLLQTATTQVDINGILRYATSLLWRTPEITLHAPKEAVLPSLCSTERRLARDPKKAGSY